ncbi:dTDP-4-dehydrorhamnose 3,5-epimerase family protein, partial [Escherichia coli]|nr:dTDP-4-dehydrorhamnose 3,5-epimerase family protein [Escherichia coli]
AHGFLVLSEIAEFVYKTTNYYHPESEGCIKWDDSFLMIDWPNKPIAISEKDKKGSSILRLNDY